MPHFSHTLRCGCRLGVPADSSQGPRPFRLPGDPERFARSRPFEIVHLKLDIRLEVPARRVEATATLEIQQRDPDARTLVLDAVGFEIESVRVVGGANGSEGRALPYRYDGDRIHVRLGPLDPDARSRVAVRYRATPTRGLYFIAPDEAHPGRPAQVWSQCQDEDAKYWVPCHDFPNMRMSTEFAVTAPAGWTAISNGRLVAHTTSADGEEHWHWHQEAPHVAYLMTLVAAKFSELTDDQPGLPVRYYVDPGSEADGWRAFKRTPEMIRHFAERFGVEYPWAKYYQAVVHEFTFGGMENTSATTMTDLILLDERAALDNTADDLVAHELAHQWFGDLVTCRDWSHAWLNEGFATFCEHVDWERKGGRDAYLYNLKRHADAYFGEDGGRYRRPIVCNTYAFPIDLFDHHLYEKGGWVLHMLRAELGDRLFFGGVKRYLERHRGGLVETRDLLRALEDHSGRSLEGFFDQWLYRAGYPELEIEAAHDDDRGLLSVTVRQTQKVDAVTPLFRLRIALGVVTAEGETHHVLDVTEAAQTFTLVASNAPVRLAVDPDGALLATWAQKLPRDWLLDALANDARGVVRWRAAAALATRDEGPVVDALARAAREDAFWGVGIEAAHALGEIRSAQAFDALVALVDVPEPRVRRAVVRALGEFRTERSAQALLAHLARGDASVLVEAECARAAGRTRQSVVFDALVAALDRRSWRDLVRAAAIDGLGALRDARALPHVVRFTDPGPTVFVRRAAVAALAELGEGEGKRAVRERLEGIFAQGDDPYLFPAVLAALVKLRDAGALAAIERLLSRSRDGRVARHAREAVRALRGEAQPDELRRLSDALDRLRDEQRALRDEMAKLRAVAVPDDGTRDDVTRAGKSKAKSASRGAKKARAGAAKPVRSGSRKAGAKEPRRSARSTRGRS